MEPTNNPVSLPFPIDALSIVEKITKIETVLVFLTEKTKEFQSDLKNIQKSLYGGVACNGIDNLLNEIQTQLQRMEKSIQGLEDDLEEKLFDTLWQGLSRRLRAIAKDHATELLLGAAGVVAALFKLMFN